MQQYIDKLNRIIYTLNLVSVRGKENLDCLLASIQSLDKMKNEMLEEMNNVAENK